MVVGKTEQPAVADTDFLHTPWVRAALPFTNGGLSGMVATSVIQPVDMIKVDRSFVSRMLDDERARAIVSSLVTMGTALGVDVVAEGVETRDQAECLAGMGCHLAQGFWWSRPVPEEEFLQLVSHPLTSVQVA